MYNIINVFHHNIFFLYNFHVLRIFLNSKQYFLVEDNSFEVLSHRNLTKGTKCKF